MIISSMKSIESVPTPALGLLPAIHDAEIEEVPLVGGLPVLPLAEACKGRVFRNQTAKAITLPPTSKWPARSLEAGGVFGSDGRLFYKVRQKPGTTSYYPESFERTLYTFAFSPQSFSAGSEFDLSRLFYFRLMANTSSAVWSVIFEIGVRTNQTTPTLALTMQGTLTSGSANVTISDPQLGSLFYRMVATGSGIPSGLDGTTYIKSINLATSTLVLSRPATQSGARSLTFTAPVGPNLGDFLWLPPLMEQEVLLTEMKTINPMGIWIKNWGDKNVQGPDGSSAPDPYRNDLGYQGFAKLFDKATPVPLDSLPTERDFLLRVRIGQFDTENSVADPKGYAAYMVRAIDDEEDSAATMS
jgi:hypothetical protein